MDVLDKIRLLVVNRQVVYSYHSVTEKLTEINQRRRLNLTEDDGLEIVCRIRGNLVIITVYEPYN